MAFQHFIITTSAILLATATTVSAHPRSHDLRALLHSTNPSTLSLLVPPTQVSNHTNTTPISTPPPPAPIGVIECFPPHPSRPKTDVDGCRFTLNYIRSFPNYRKIQDFLVGWYPKVPSKPPYAVHDKRSNCAVQIDTSDPRIADDFSFEHVRALATEILEVCRDKGGRGGFAPIGHGVGWRVAVVGFVAPRPGDEDGGIGMEGVA